MRVLVAGATGSGKSSLARAVCGDAGGINIVNTSNIREALRTVVSPEAHPDLFTSTYRPVSDFEPPIPHFTRQAALVVPAIAAVLKRMEQDEEILMAEGVHVTPSMLEFLPRAHTFAVVMLQPSDEEHRNRLIERGQKDSRKGWPRYAQHFGSIRSIGQYIEESWRACSEVPVFEVRTLAEGVEVVSRMTRNRDLVDMGPGGA